MLCFATLMPYWALMIVDMFSFWENCNMLIKNQIHSPSVKLCWQLLCNDLYDYDIELCGQLQA
uniref:Uncharacterized protein n=1 Tax=Arundo donax TaxID=35708 RepID=A0A0A9BG28_ARUDO